MANPQADKFVKLSNELYEAIMQSDFSKRQRNVIDLIIRMSYGCGKTHATLKMSDFEIVGILRTNIKKEIELLKRANVIEVDGQNMKLNKDYDKWRISLVSSFDPEKFKKVLHRNLIEKSYQNDNRTNERLSKQELESYQNDNSTVIETITDTSLEASNTNEFQPPKDSIKDSIKDINNNNNESPDSWLEEFEAEHASKQPLIKEIESYYKAKKGEDPNLPTKDKDFRMISDAVDKYSREEIIDGINHAFLTAEEVYSFKYCLDCMETQKQYREKQRQQQQWNQLKQQKKKQPYNKPDSNYPIAIRQQMEREERAKLGIPEPEPTPEELAQQEAAREEVNRMLREMEEQKGEIL